MITIKNLTKRYPRAKDFALRGVNLSIKKGEFFGLLGPNGGGKTTLISILCGLLSATSGNISIDGKTMPKHMKHLKPLINLVPQEIALYPTLTLKENLSFFGYLYGLRGQSLKNRINECIETTSLQTKGDLLIASFSGGMKRRANLAISLINRPKILFLDEPTVNVDPQSRHTLFEIIKNQNKEGTTVIYTTQYLEEAELLCNRIAILDYGKIVESDTPENLIKNTPNCKNLADVVLHLTGQELRD